VKNQGTSQVALAAWPLQRPCGTNRNPYLALFFLIGQLTNVFVRADIAISFPLEGHYRPGRYMPVHVVGSAAGRDITLQSEGSLPLILSAGTGSIDVTAPWLTVSPLLQHAVWIDNSEHPLAATFEPLADYQRLVGMAGIDMDQARTIFTNGEIVPARLDVTNPLPGPVAAWESLDGLLLDENSAARVTDNQLRTLLAAGTTVAIRSERKPGGAWPWKQSGAFWVVSHPRMGPQSLVEPGAFGPTYGWVRGIPWDARRRALLAGVIVCVLLIGAALLPASLPFRHWKTKRPPLQPSPGVAGEGERTIPSSSRSQGGVLAIAVVAVSTSLLWIAWQRHLQPIDTMSAQVVAESGSLTEHDRWTWISSPVALDSTFAAGGLTHPIFFTHLQIDRTQMRVVCAGNDQPISFRFHLEPQSTVAFDSATMDDEPDRHALTTSRSNVVSMVEEVYVNPRLNVAGEYEDGDGAPIVVGQSNDGGR
jgi:hypothetical protein